MANETCVIYCRISLDSKGDELGVSRQESECRELAERNDWAVTEVYVDNDISATTGKVRPGFEAMLAARPSRIVVWNTDRLVRLLTDLSKVIDLGGTTVHSVRAGTMDLSSASGLMQAQMLTVFAEFEGRQKGERMRAQQRQRAERGGLWWSARPFGYERDGSLCRSESDLIGQAYADLARGGTYVDIATGWNEAGALTTKGSTWTANATRQVLLSPRNAGLLESHGKIVGPGSWTAIIEADEWRAIVRRAGDPAMRRKGQGQRKGLLSGIATCGTCGKPAQWRSRSGRSRGTVRKVYGAPCGHSSAPVEWLDTYLTKALLRRASSPAAQLAWARRDGDDDTGLREALREAERVRAQLDELTDAFTSREITREQLTRGSAVLRDELAPLEAKAEQLYQPTPGPLGKYTGLAALVAAWKSEELALDARRAIIRRMVERIEILPKLKGAKQTAEYVSITWKAWA